MKIVYVKEDSLLRFEAYKKICDKYKSEIKTIQKYKPEWVPKFIDKPYDP
jgi:hypothetical protein